jgi:hypothetical protein
MAVRVGINGFGRIGRQVLKAIKEFYPGALEVVAINDLFDSKTNAHLFKYDSNYGIYPGPVEVVENDLMVDGQRVREVPVGVELTVFGQGYVVTKRQAAGEILDRSSLAVREVEWSGRDVLPVEAGPGPSLRLRRPVERPAVLAVSRGFAVDPGDGPVRLRDKPLELVPRPPPTDR